MNLDELDHSILNQLKGNARMSFAEIGRKVGLTPPAVAQRIQKMERDGPIKGYDLNLDHSKMGYDLLAYVTVKLELGKMPEFKKLLATLPEVLECHRITGEDCMILKIMLKNNDHLIEVVDQLVQYGYD